MSNNGGTSWSNISLQDSDGYVDSKFSNVSRLVVDPNNSDIVVISTVGSCSIHCNINVDIYHCHKVDHDVTENYWNDEK